VGEGVMFRPRPFVRNTNHPISLGSILAPNLAQLIKTLHITDCNFWIDIRISLRPIIQKLKRGNALKRTVFYDRVLH